MPSSWPDMARFVEEHGRRGVLLDANLLVLYVAGRHDLRLLSSLKATRSLGFGERDFRLVVGVAGALGPLLTTPHVLTEVNGLLNTGLPGRHRWDVLATFSGVIAETVETSRPAPELTTDPLFRRFGPDGCIRSFPRKDWTRGHEHRPGSLRRARVEGAPGDQLQPHSPAIRRRQAPLAGGRRRGPGPRAEGVESRSAACLSIPLCSPSFTTRGHAKCTTAPVTLVYVRAASGFSLRPGPCSSAHSLSY